MEKSSVASLAVISSLLLIAGCATVPTGPRVTAFPGSGKSFEQFRIDDAECRQYAQYQVGGRDASQAAVDSGVRSAAVGTVIGALAGAAIGGHQGAAVGAGAGLLMGSAVGADDAQRSGYGTQRNYDQAYLQCMYAKGEQVPVPGVVARSRYQYPAAVASPRSTAIYPPPPPPADYLPPPPPG